MNNDPLQQAIRAEIDLPPGVFHVFGSVRLAAITPVGIGIAVDGPGGLSAIGGGRLRCLPCPGNILIPGKHFHLGECQRAVAAGQFDPYIPSGGPRLGAGWAGSACQQRHYFFIEAAAHARIGHQRQRFDQVEQPTGIALSEFPYLPTGIAATEGIDAGERHIADAAQLRPLGRGGQCFHVAPQFGQLCRRSRQQHANQVKHRCRINLPGPRVKGLESLGSHPHNTCAAGLREPLNGLLPEAFIEPAAQQHRVVNSNRPRLLCQLLVAQRLIEIGLPLWGGKGQWQLGRKCRLELRHQHAGRLSLHVIGVAIAGEFLRDCQSLHSLRHPQIAGGAQGLQPHAGAGINRSLPCQFECAGHPVDD